jgi:ribonuclease Z
MRPNSILALMIAALAVLSGTGLADAAEQKVTLLGTGTPTPRLSALSASTLVEAGPEKLIFVMKTAQ